MTGSQGKRYSPGLTGLRLLLLILLGAFTLLAHGRTALIIGNGDYPSAPLDNPVNDATDIARKLEALGFDVSVLTNSSRRDMRRAIREYSENLRRSGGVGLFYYAGHGMQIQGVNYLIPTDAVMASEFEIPDEAVSANSVLRAVEDAGNDLNIVILDACRDNPFARSYRSATRGLARMDAPGGSIIAYATAPGNVALDGDGRNGVYTKHLLNNMDKPGMPIEQMFKKVRIGVIDESQGKQTPWEESSLRSDFYFRPAEVYEVNVPDNRQDVPTLSSQRVTPQPATDTVTGRNNSEPELITPGPAKVAAARPAPEPSGSAPGEADRLLSRAEAALNDYRLTTPKGDSALYYYRRVLEIDPVNLEAHDGLQMITRRYISLAEREIRNSNPKKARAFISRGMDIQPSNYQLSELEKQVDELEVRQAMLAARTESPATSEPIAEESPEDLPPLDPVPESAPPEPAMSASLGASQPEPVAEEPPVLTQPVSSPSAPAQSAASPQPETVPEPTADATADMAAVDAPRSTTERMKQDFNRDVDEFKSSIKGIGSTLKSAFGGFFDKKEGSESER